MKSQLFQGSIVVKKSPIQGHGVFAQQDFKSGELIEECKVLLSKFSDSYRNYIFKCKHFGEKLVGMPLGYGALYNHGDDPNADYYYDADLELLVFFAIRTITKGEEILVTYGETWFSDRGLNVKYPFRYWVRRIITRKVWRFLLVCGFLGCLVVLIH